MHDSRVLAAPDALLTMASAPHASTATASHASASSELDVAEMELMGAANRDMFSWLLFNSENISAPSALAAGHVDPSHVHHSHGLDDPFRMLGPSTDTSLSLAMHATPTPLVQTGPLTVSLPAAATPVTPSTESAPRRGKKRGADDAASPTTTPKQPAAPHPKALSATQEGLLRHLESANNALVQKRQALASSGGAGSIVVPKTEKPGSGGSSGGESPSSVQRRQKLERNRESARECRRRKREHILGVEERCRQLERENMELRGQLKAGKEAMRQEEKDKNRVCEELEQMIQGGASEKELAEKIDNFKEQYSDYGHGRRSALNYHLHQTERLLLPTQVTKMCIWALRQDDSFWQDEEDETSLPVILARELGLSEEQKKKIQQQRYVSMRWLGCVVGAR